MDPTLVLCFTKWHQKCEDHMPVGDLRYMKLCMPTFQLMISMMVCYSNIGKCEGGGVGVDLDQGEDDWILFQDKYTLILNDNTHSLINMWIKEWPFNNSGVGSCVRKIFGIFFCTKEEGWIHFRPWRGGEICMPH